MKKHLPYSIHTLANGCRVILYKDSHVQSMHVRVDIKNGPIFETDDNWGISHFVEHYLHQGTRDFPTSIDMNIFEEKHGMFQNGATNSYGTWYFVQGLKEKYKEAIQLVYNIVCLPTFPKERLQHVREVIANEFRDYWHDPESKFYKNLAQMRFADFPYVVQNSLGSLEHIMNFSVSDVKAWYGSYYNPANFIVTVSGNVNEDQVLKELEATFGKETKKNEVQYPKPQGVEAQPFELLYDDQDREQVQFVVTMPTFGFKERTEEERLVLNGLCVLLGNGQLSRLYQSLREKRNLVYRVNCSSNYYFDRGYISITGMCHSNAVVEVYTIVAEELQKVLRDGFTEDELETSKVQGLSSLVMASDSYHYVAEHIASDLRWDDPVMLTSDLTLKIKKISLSDIETLAKEFIDFSKVHIGLFGKVGEGDREKINLIFNQ